MNAQAAATGFPFELYRAIGDDRYVTPGELPPESGDAGRALWEVYDRHFGRFPQTHRAAHARPCPASRQAIRP